MLYSRAETAQKEDNLHSLYENMKQDVCKYSALSENVLM